MKIIKTSCPSCGVSLEFPQDFDNVICARCGAAYRVRQYRGAINLSVIDTDSARSVDTSGGGRVASIDAKLAELDEEIEVAGLEVEAAKSREQAGPLQAGCAFFGVFMLVISVLALFATVAREYFGGWVFYLALAATVVVGLLRMRRKLVTPAQVEQLRSSRTALEARLAELERERDELENLRNLLSKSPNAPVDESRN
ncbi:MAG TPA: hypothetical protein VJQ56_11840 [Blastocatellia bacterium]|nr:hypothetical protein [Blastocatellia bacterium]